MWEVGCKETVETKIAQPENEDENVQEERKPDEPVNRDL